MVAFVNIRGSGWSGKINAYFLGSPNKKQANGTAIERLLLSLSVCCSSMYVVLVTTPRESSLGYKPTVRNAHCFDLIWKKGYLEQQCVSILDISMYIHMYFCILFFRFFGQKISCFFFQAKSGLFIQKINEQDSLFFCFWSLWPDTSSNAHSVSF